MKEIELLLRKYGITSPYRGYHFLKDAVFLYSKRMGAPVCFMRDIYSPIAQSRHTTTSNVDIAIHRAILKGWLHNQAAYTSLFGTSTKNYCPPNTEFIDAIAYEIYLQEHSPGASVLTYSGQDDLFSKFALHSA